MTEPVDRTDFPLARRGYDRAAVDAHLRRLRDEVAALRAQAAGAGVSGAAAAGDEVRSIVAAADTAAGEIRRKAQAAADEVRGAAVRDAEEARVHVGRVREAAGALLAQVEALEGDLERGAGALRRGEPEAAAEPEPAAAPAPRAAPEPVRAAEPELAAEAGPAAEPVPAAEPGPAGEPGPATVPAAEPVLAAVPESPATPERGVPAPGRGDRNGDGVEGDPAGARLVALQAALSGRPREEAEAEIAGLLEPGARARLLDEVYAKAGRT